MPFEQSEQQKKFWEYYIAEIDNFATGRQGDSIMEQLNALGKDGWELVTVLPISTMRTRYIFKCPINPIVEWNTNSEEVVKDMKDQPQEESKTPDNLP